MSMDFPANPTVGQIAQLGAFNYQCVATAPSQWDVVGDAEVQNIGGFNLTLEAGLAGLGLFEFDVEPGYDYELVVQGVTMGGNSERVVMDARTADGGSWVGTAMGFGETYTIAAGPPLGTNVTASPGYIGIGGTNATAFLDFHGRISNHDNAFGFFKFDYLFSCINGASQFVNASGFVWSTTPAEIDRVRISAETTTFAGGLLRVYRRSRQPLSFLTGKEPGGMYLVEELALANLPFFDVSVDPNYDYVLEMEGHYGTTSDSILNVIPDDGNLTLNIPWSVNQISTAALVNTVGDLAFQEINTTNYIPISGGQASPNGTSYAHIELNMNGNATGEVAVVTSKAMSFNSGALYSTHETIARARTLATVKMLRIGMVFAGTFNNFLSGRVLVYRRNRAITYP